MGHLKISGVVGNARKHQKSGKTPKIWKTWKLRWSQDGHKLDEFEHRGHQIEDFDSKINILGSKYSRKARKNSKIEINIFHFSNFLARSGGLHRNSYY